MKKRLIAALALSSLVLFSGCRGCGGAAPAPAATEGPTREAARFLAEQGIDPQTLRVVGPDAFITYEASQALAYDSQLWVAWGTIFGALAECAPTGVVTIVNTAGGKPAVVVKARGEDIKAYTGGKIDFKTFMGRVQFSPVK